MKSTTTSQPPPSPAPSDPALLDRVNFFVDTTRQGYLSEFVNDLAGKSPRDWAVNDFVLTPPGQERRPDPDKNKPRGPTDSGEDNLSRLMAQFAGYCRREEGIPFPRLHSVRRELYRYFVRRHQGELDPQPSMLERAIHPNRTLPKPPPPIHPLCPERITFDSHLGSLMAIMNARYHLATALFLAMPAWLRFLEVQRLIDAATRRKVVEDLLPLHAQLVRIWETFADDPTLLREGQLWTADAAKDALT